MVHSGVIGLFHWIFRVFSSGVLALELVLDAEPFPDLAKLCVEIAAASFVGGRV